MPLSNCHDSDNVTLRAAASLTADETQEALSGQRYRAVSVCLNFFRQPDFPDLVESWACINSSVQVHSGGRAKGEYWQHRKMARSWRAPATLILSSPYDWDPSAPSAGTTQPAAAGSPHLRGLGVPPREAAAAGSGDPLRSDNTARSRCSAPLTGGEPGQPVSPLCAVRKAGDSWRSVHERYLQERQCVSSSPACAESQAPPDELENRWDSTGTSNGYGTRGQFKRREKLSFR